jgi:hypothetical protein
MRAAILVAMISVFFLSGGMNLYNADRDCQVVRSIMVNYLTPKRVSPRLSVTIEKLYMSALSRIPIFFNKDSAYMQYGTMLYEIDMERKNIASMADIYE